MRAFTSEVFDAKRFNTRQSVRKNDVVCSPLSDRMLSADFLRYGGSVHYRTVQRSGSRFCRSGGQSGHAHAHCSDRRTRDGNDCLHQQVSGSRLKETCGGVHWQLSSAVQRVCGSSYDPAARLHRRNPETAGSPCRGARAGKAVSDHLFYRRTLYNGLQRGEQYFPRVGRYEESHDFCCHRRTDQRGI